MTKHPAEAYQCVQSDAERERILMEQLPQVRYIARRIHERLPRHVPFEDLVHAGVVGLIDALNKFDLSKQVQFSSYAKFRIRGAILDSLRELDWSPRELRRKGRLVDSVYCELSGKLGRAPDENEIAQEMNISLHELQSLLAELDGLNSEACASNLRATARKRTSPITFHRNLRRRHFSSACARKPSICWNEPSPNCRKRNSVFWRFITTKSSL